MGFALGALGPLGVAASGIGSLINYGIQQSAIDAQNRLNRQTMDLERKARRRETRRQAGFEADQFANAIDALMSADPASRVDAVASAPAVDFTSALDRYGTDTLQGQNPSADVREGIAKEIADRISEARGALEAQARLSAGDSLASSVGDALIRAASRSDTVGTKRRGSLGVARLETSIPVPTVTPSQSPIGDLLMLGGQLGAGLGGKKIGGLGINYNDPFSYWYGG